MNVEEEIERLCKKYGCKDIDGVLKKQKEILQKD